MRKPTKQNDKAALHVLRDYLRSEKELQIIKGEIKRTMDDADSKLYLGQITTAEFERQWDLAIHFRARDQDRLEKRIPLLRSLLNAWEQNENIVLVRLQTED